MTSNPQDFSRSPISDAERLAAIVATQNAISASSLDLQAVMQLIVERTMELTAAEGAAFELRDGDEMVYRATCGTAAPFLDLRLSIQSSLSGRSVLTGEILKCEDAETDPRVDREACRKVNARSMIVVPLRYENKVQGVLKVLSSTPAHFQEGDVQTLELMAGLLGAMVSHATTVRVQKEEVELQAQQLRLFDTALTWIADYVFICDLEGRITYANRARLQLWRRELKDVLGKNFHELGYGDELATRVHAQIQTVIATKQPFRAEALFSGPAGTGRYYEYILVPILGTDGEVEAIAGSTRDISAIHDERERLADLFEQAPAFIAVLHGPRHIFERANPACQQLVGYRELLGKTVGEALPEIEGQGFIEILDEVYRTGKPYIGNNVRVLLQEAGKTLERFLDFVYQPLSEPDGTISGILVHGVDRTQRQLAEEALRSSNAYLKDILESISDPFFAVDKQFRFTYANRHTEEMWGKQRGELLGKTMLEVFPSIAGSESYGKHLEAAQTRRPIHYEAISPIINRWVEVYIYPSQEGLVIYFRDISARKEAEETLRQSDERFAKAFGASPEGMGISRESDGLLYEVNESFLRIYGYTREEAIGRSAVDLGLYADRSERDEVIRKIQAEGHLRDYEITGRHRSGELRTVLHSVERIQIEGEPYLLAIQRDITEQKQRQMEIERLNERLRRSMRETHHRVKNNLQVITAMLDMQVMMDKESVPMTEVVRLRQHISALAAVHDLLTHQAAHDADVTAIPVKAALEKLLPMLQAMLHERRLALTVEDALLPVRQATTLSVLVNEIVSNAGKHGKGAVKVSFTHDSKHATLTVSDEGPGFPEDFVPYKAANTGLDLIESLTRHDLAGYVTYTNRPEGGGLVTLRFPIPHTV